VGPGSDYDNAVFLPLMLLRDRKVGKHYATSQDLSRPEVLLSFRRLPDLNALESLSLFESGAAAVTKVDQRI
jgi:hypothetical protein